MPSSSRKRKKGQARKVNQAPVPFGSMLQVLRANLNHGCYHGLISAAHHRVRTRFTERFHSLWVARWAAAESGSKFAFSTDHTMQAISDTCQEYPSDLKHAPTRNFLKTALLVTATDCLLMVKKAKDGHCVPSGLPRGYPEPLLLAFGHSLARGAAYIEKCEMNGCESIPVPINAEELSLDSRSDLERLGTSSLVFLFHRTPCSCLDELYKLATTPPKTGIFDPCSEMREGRGAKLCIACTEQQCHGRECAGKDNCGHKMCPAVKGDADNLCALDTDQLIDACQGGRK